MKLMKSMVESMMPLMMKGISSEEKEDLMLKMMPMMMEDIDLTELMPRMMNAMLPAMLPELLAFLSKDGAHEKLLELFATVMPNVCEVIDKPKLAEKKDALLADLMSHEIFREKMPKCFTAGFPVMFKGFVDHFYPAITIEERNAFISQMISNLIISLSQNDKEKLLRELIQ
ncbi:MAG: hypothetical protein PVH37_20765 [Desulfobacterales bacterium]|jgi:hypothetical protein